MTILSINATTTVTHELVLNGDELAEFCKRHGCICPNSYEELKQNSELMGELERLVVEEGEPYGGEFEIIDYDEEDDS